MTKTWIEKLKKQEACDESIAWAKEYPTAQAAWDACERGDWMLWAWDRNCGNSGSESHRMLVLCAVECVKTSLKYVKNKDVKKLIKKSLDTTERWAKGEEGVTLDDVKNAANAAANAAAAAGAAAGDDGTNSATDATWCVAYAAVGGDLDYAAAAAANTAYAAGDAVAAADYRAARTKALKKCADIIRKIQQKCPRFKRVTG